MTESQYNLYSLQMVLYGFYLGAQCCFILWVLRQKKLQKDEQ